MGSNVVANAGWGIKITDEFLIKLFEVDVNNHMKEFNVEKKEALDIIKIEKDINLEVEKLILNKDEKLDVLGIIEVGGVFDEIETYIIIYDVLNELEIGLERLSKIFGKTTKDDLVWVCDLKQY